MKSRLLLKDYTFHRVDVSANDIALDDGDCNLVTKRTYWNAEGCPYDWKILLEIDFGKNEAITASYYGSIAVVGFVEVDSSYPEDQIADLVKITGSSLLFGAAREMLAIVTSRGPYKTLLLPSISFYDMDNEAKAQREKDAVDDSESIAGNNT
jgi:preprotein translocase subunit SecB